MFGKMRSHRVLRIDGQARGEVRAPLDLELMDLEEAERQADATTARSPGGAGGGHRWTRSCRS